jgi:hypothetical protein
MEANHCAILDTVPDRMELETDDNGALIVPAEAIGSPEPHSRFLIQHAGDGWLLKPKTAETAGSILERLRAFDQWLESLPPGPGLPPDAVRRDAIYE